VFCQTVPRRGVTRIHRQRLTVQRVGLRVCLGRLLSPEFPGLQVQSVRLRVSCPRARHSTEQRYLEFLDHLARDLVLDLEDVVERAVPGLGLDVIAARRADQLRRDAHLVAGLADRALEDVGDVKATGNFWNLYILTLERK